MTAFSDNPTTFKQNTKRSVIRWALTNSHYNILTIAMMIFFIVVSANSLAGFKQHMIAEATYEAMTSINVSKLCAESATESDCTEETRVTLEILRDPVYQELTQNIRTNEPLHIRPFSTKLLEAIFEATSYRDAKKAELTGQDIPFAEWEVRRTERLAASKAQVDKLKLRTILLGLVIPLSLAVIALILYGRIYFLYREEFKSFNDHTKQINSALTDQYLDAICNQSKDSDT
ncbi:hypothetical protein AB4254_11535 [Vibrio breoganii]